MVLRYKGVLLCHLAIGEICVDLPSHGSPHRTPVQMHLINRFFAVIDDTERNITGNGAMSNSERSRESAKRLWRCVEEGSIRKHTNKYGKHKVPAKCFQFAGTLCLYGKINCLWSERENWRTGTSPCCLDFSIYFYEHWWKGVGITLIRCLSLS